MINRRLFLSGLAATALATTVLTDEALAHHVKKRRRRALKRARRKRKPFRLARRFEPQRVFYRRQK